jgi:hypothetical protein
MQAIRNQAAKTTESESGGVLLDIPRLTGAGPSIRRYFLRDS